MNSCIFINQHGYFY